MIYNSHIPLENPLIDSDGSLSLNNAYQTIEELKTKYPHWSLSLSAHSIKNAQQELKNKKYNNSLISIKKTIINIFTFRKKQKVAEPLNFTFNAIKDLLTAYEKIIVLGKPKINKNIVQAEIIVVSKIKEAAFAKLQNTNQEKAAISFDLGEKLFDQAKTDFNSNNFPKAEIELMVAKLLFMEI